MGPRYTLDSEFVQLFLHVRTGAIMITSSSLLCWSWNQKSVHCFYHFSVTLWKLSTMWKSSCPRSEAPVSLTAPRQFLSGACVWLLLGQLRPVAGRADSGLLPQRLTYLIGLGRPPSLPPTPRGCGLLWKSGELKSLWPKFLPITTLKGNDILLLVVLFYFVFGFIQNGVDSRGSSKHEIKTNFITVLRYYWPLWLHWLCTDVWAVMGETAGPWASLKTVVPEAAGSSVLH